ncbi:ABC transporter substrate-binding protein [Myroides sp. LJL115]
MQKKQLLFSVLFLIGFLFLQSCTKVKDSAQHSKSSTHSVVATDSRGKQVTLDTIATKVAVLFTPIVEEIYMLGAQDQLTAITQEVYLQQDTYDFLSTLDPRIKNKQISAPTFNGRAISMENIIALEPDLVILLEQENDTSEQLESLGYKVFTVDGSQPLGIVEEFLGIATLMGKDKRAKELIDYYTAESNKLKQRAESVQEKKSIYYSWSKGRILSTSGKGSLMDFVITSSGALNACPLDIDAPNLSPETLYLWNPDLMVLWNTPQKDVYDLKELAALPAVVNKQVYELTPTFNFNPHTLKILLFSKQLQSWAYPQIYSPEEFQKELKQDLDFFYGLSK